jgi:hypothetical protein
LGGRRTVKEVNGGTIQQIQKTQIEGPSTSMERWNTTWSDVPNIPLVEAQKI